MTDSFKSITLGAPLWLGLSLLPTTKVSFQGEILLLFTEELFDLRVQNNYVELCDPEVNRFTEAT